MTGPSPAELLRHLGDAASDRDLLARFVHHRDQAAFAQLVRRHGPVVLGVCRRVAGHSQDAEDAFQAAFLVLARKAAVVANPDLLGNYLYGVAVRVAQKARRAAARRRAREVQVSTMPDPAAAESCPPLDIGPVLHDELSKLPACYRDAIVLCDLRGVTRADAAVSLGVPEGTLSSRLANGRKKLADRLARRGVALSAAALPVVVAEGVAAVPEKLVTKTCGLVADWTAGVVLPAPVSRLAAGGFDVKKWLAVGVCTAALAAAGVVFAGRPEPLPDAPKSPVARSAEPAEPAAEQKAEAKPTPFTSRPRMRQAADLPIKSVSKVVWSPDGKYLAVAGTTTGDGGQNTGMNTILLVSEAPRGGFEYHWVHPGRTSSLVGFTPDSKYLVTDRREYDLVSGFHQVQFWEPSQNVGGGDRAFGPPGGDAKGAKELFGGAPPKAATSRGEWVSSLTIDLEEPDTFDYAFAADGKTFRTVYRELDRPGVFTRLEVREVSAWTGATRKTIRKFDGEYTGFQLSPNGRHLVLINAAELVVWNLDKGTKETPQWQPEDRSEFESPPASRQQTHVQFTPDSRRFFAARQGYPLAIVDSDTGAVVKTLKDGRSYIQMPRQCFTTDGRLLVTSGMNLNRASRPTPVGATSVTQVPVLKVWETEAGTPLKVWDREAKVAFRPARPVLAVLEPNGETTTRLGLWDFAAEKP